jgi:Fic family protein
LPPQVDTRTPEILQRVAQARTELGELKGLSRALPNALILLSPSVIRESVASSRIENVNTTVQNALQMQLFPEAEQRGPDKEVLHYRDALLAGFESMSMVPLSARTIHLIHETLLPKDQMGVCATHHPRRRRCLISSRTGSTTCMVMQPRPTRW